MIRDPFAVLVVLTGTVWLALRLEERWPLCRSLGAALVGILIGMVLSNSGVLPGESPAYDWLGSMGVSLAVAMILLSVDLRSVRAAGPIMLGAFAIGAVGTAIGATVGALLFHRSVGPETWKLAGQFTGTYTGGGMNFAALGRAFDTSSDLFTAAVAADVALTALWMAACLTAPLILGRGSTRSQEPAEARSDGIVAALTSSVRPLAIGELAALVTIAGGAVWVAGRLAATWPVPEVLWLTAIVLIVAQIPTIKQLSGAAVLGNYILLLFLAANGAQSVLANIFRVGPVIFWFAAITVTAHGLVIFGVGRLAGIDAGTLAVASQANVGGPASAVALASARGYGDRVLPGVAVGLAGYAIGNFAGVAIGNLIRVWLA